MTKLVKCLSETDARSLDLSKIIRVEQPYNYASNTFYITTTQQYEMDEANRYPMYVFNDYTLDIRYITHLYGQEWQGQVECIVETNTELELVLKLMM